MAPFPAFPPPDSDFVARSLAILPSARVQDPAAAGLIWAKVKYEDDPNGYLTMAHNAGLLLDYKPAEQVKKEGKAAGKRPVAAGSSSQAAAPPAKKRKGGKSSSSDESGDESSSSSSDDRGSRVAGAASGNKAKSSH